MEAPAAAAEVPSQAAAGTGTPQRSATVSSKGKVPAGNFAAAATSPQHVAKIVAPPQKPASISVGASTQLALLVQLRGAQGKPSLSMLRLQHSRQVQSPPQLILLSRGQQQLRPPRPLPTKQLQGRRHP